MTAPHVSTKPRCQRSNLVWKPLSYSQLLAVCLDSGFGVLAFGLSALSCNLFLHRTLANVVAFLNALNKNTQVSGFQRGKLLSFSPQTGIWCLAQGNPEIWKWSLTRGFPLLRWPPGLFGSDVNRLNSNMNYKLFWRIIWLQRR